MSVSGFSFIPGAMPSGPPGATAATGALHQHDLGDAVRAIRVYVVSFFEVTIFGEYAEEAGVMLRRH